MYVNPGEPTGKSYKRRNVHTFVRTSRAFVNVDAFIMFADSG